MGVCHEYSEFNSRSLTGGWIKKGNHPLCPIISLWGRGESVIGIVLVLIQGCLTVAGGHCIICCSSRGGGNRCPPPNINDECCDCKFLDVHFYGRCFHDLLLLICDGHLHGSYWLWRSYHQLNCILKRLCSDFLFR